MKLATDNARRKGTASRVEIASCFYCFYPQYRRIVHQWVATSRHHSTVYGTHTMRRTKATLIYKRTKNLTAFQLLVGHTTLELAG